MFDSECDSPTPKKGRIYMGAFYLELQIYCKLKTVIGFLVLTKLEYFSYAGLKRRLKVNAHLYKSPPSTFALPSYAERLAKDFVCAPSPVLSDSTHKHFGESVLRYIDFEADECDQHFSGASPSAQYAFISLLEFKIGQCHLHVVALPYY